MGMNIQFHKILGSFWVAAQLAASQEGLSPMKLVTGDSLWEWRGRWLLGKICGRECAYFGRG
jgi:hypothetical protein